MMETLFEDEAHHFGCRGLVQDDDGITVPAGVKRLDQGIALFEQEPVIPVSDNIGDIAFVDHPAVLGQGTGHCDSDRIVVAVWATTLPIVVEDAVACTDTDRPVLADV